MGKLAIKQTHYNQLKRKVFTLMDKHESDLYALKTPESEAIIKAWDYPHSVSTFISQIDGGVWYDIPFAFKPWWDARLS